MTTVTFTVHGTPAGKGSWRCIGTRGRHQLIPDNRPALKAWNKTLAAGVAAAAQVVGVMPDGPVVVRAQFVLPRPETVPLRRRPWPHRRGSDCDKLLRSLLDCLQPALIGDDANVCDVRGRKYYPDTPGAPLAEPGAVITVRTMEPEGTLL